MSPCVEIRWQMPRSRTPKYIRLQIHSPLPFERSKLSYESSRMELSCCMALREAGKPKYTFAPCERRSNWNGQQ